jgi:hypothetical protein
MYKRTFTSILFSSALKLLFTQLLNSVFFFTSCFIVDQTLLPLSLFFLSPVLFEFYSKMKTSVFSFYALIFLVVTCGEAFRSHPTFKLIKRQVAPPLILTSANNGRLLKRDNEESHFWKRHQSEMSVVAGV